MNKMKHLVSADGILSVVFSFSYHLHFGITRKLTFLVVLFLFWPATCYRTAQVSRLIPIQNRAWLRAWLCIQNSSFWGFPELPGGIYRAQRGKRAGVKAWLCGMRVCQTEPASPPRRGRGARSPAASSEADITFASICLLLCLD